MPSCSTSRVTSSAGCAATPWASKRVSAMKPCRLGRSRRMRCKRLSANFAKAALPIFVCLVTACAHQQEKMPPRTQDRPLDYRIQSQERAERASWQKPDEVVQALTLKNGEVIADIGAGTGYFSRPLAKAVAPDGKVYAVDVAADVLQYLKERADKEGIGNIVTIVSREEDPMLPKNAVDLVFFSATTHHIVNRVPFYRAMAPGLKQGGRVAIIEMEDAGFKYVKDFEFLRDQYFLIFEKP